MKIEHLQGLIAAPFTPMKKNGSLNAELIPSYYQFLKQNKVTGAFICGSTGEGVSLTIQEKKDCTKAWADCTKDDKFAQHQGIYAVSFTAPFYFKPANVEMLTQCCRQIADAVAEMPFYLLPHSCLERSGFSYDRTVK